MTPSSSYAGQFAPRFAEFHNDRDLLWVPPFRVSYLVGLAGDRFAGKSTALAYLAEAHAFRSYSISTILREIAVERGIPLHPRWRLQDLGDELRAGNEDGGYLARLLLRRIRRDHLSHDATGIPARIAVTGFKHGGEVEVFQALSRFHMLVVESDDRVRWRRGRDSGVLASELNELSASVLDLGRLRPTFRNFVDYIDRRDREGWNKIVVDDSSGKSDRNAWGAGYDQNVSAVVAASRRTGPRWDRSVPNGTAEDPTSNRTRLYGELDAVVEQMEQMYRATRI